MKATFFSIKQFQICRHVGRCLETKTVACREDESSARDRSRETTGGEKTGY